MSTTYVIARAQRDQFATEAQETGAVLTAHGQLQAIQSRLKAFTDGQHLFRGREFHVSPEKSSIEHAVLLAATNPFFKAPQIQLKPELSNNFQNAADNGETAEELKRWINEELLGRIEAAFSNARLNKLLTAREAKEAENRAREVISNINFDAIETPENKAEITTDFNHSTIILADRRMVLEILNGMDFVKLGTSANIERDGWKIENVPASAVFAIIKTADTMTVSEKYAPKKP